ncbi:MAG: hypothetical protein H6Q72_732 [Firmicutes bacterium]|nr:hypothetical protein [Bacillota bacterium]
MPPFFVGRISSLTNLLALPVEIVVGNTPFARNLCNFSNIYYINQT